MENRIFLERFRLSLDRNGLPVELHRSPLARIYRAQEIQTGREVALTLVSPAPGDPVVLQRLETAAVAGEKINHINLPRLYDFGLENSELVYVSEYCDGPTASAWVGARGPLSTAAVLRVALQVVDAMSATAFQRLYHSALHPNNILFVAGQTVEGDWPPIKVLHWFGPSSEPSGMAEGQGESATHFAAPEQLSEGKVDVRSEIYSLGATMWFLLTGAPPVVAATGLSKAELAKLSVTPKIVRHLLGRMLRPNPEERPQDPVALANYLQTCLARLDRRTRIERRFGIPLKTQPRVSQRKPRTPIPLKPMALAAAILLIATIGLLFLPFSSSRRHREPFAGQADSLPRSLPNEVPVVRKDSLGQIDVPKQDLPPAAVAAASETPSESASAVQPSPGATAVAAMDLESNEIPRDELASTETVGPVNPESSAPEEGPNESPTGDAPPLTADQPSQTPVESSSASEPVPEHVIKPPPVAETNEPQLAAAVPPPADVTPAEKPKPAAKRSDRALASKSSLAIHSAAKRKSDSVAKQSRSHSPKKRDQTTRTARRAQPLPRLRVGSAPAELVGTTNDGRWILSVADTGERVVVPPPPGYGQ